MTHDLAVPLYAAAIALFNAGLHIHSEAFDASLVRQGESLSDDDKSNIAFTLCRAARTFDAARAAYAALEDGSAVAACEEKIAACTHGLVSLRDEYPSEWTLRAVFDAWDGAEKRAHRRAAAEARGE